MLKDHMRDPDNPEHTRCGLSIKQLREPCVIVWEYGSPKTICKTCLRLHAQDLAKGGDDQ